MIFTERLSLVKKHCEAIYDSILFTFSNKCCLKMVNGRLHHGLEKQQEIKKYFSQTFSASHIRPHSSEKVVPEGEPGF